MANINALIAQGVDPIQLENPMNQMAKMYAIRAAQQESQLNQMKMQEAQQKQAEAAAFNQAYAQSYNPQTGEVDINKLRQSVATSGYASRLPEIEKKLTEERKGRFDIAEQRRKFLAQAQRDISANPSDAQIMAHYEDVANSGLFQPSELTRFKASIDQLMPLSIDERRAFLAQQGATAGELKPTQKVIDLNNQQVMVQMPAFGGKPVEMGRYQKGMAPGEAERIAIARRNAAVAEQRLTAEQATGEYSPETIDFLAETYIQTGTLPPLGIGKKAAAIKMNVLDRARQLATGAGAAATPGEAAVPKATTSEAVSNIAQAKQTRAAEQATVRSFATGVEGRSVRSFNTAINHLDTMDKLATALQNNDVRSFNAIGNMFAKETGKPAPTDFDAAKAIVGGEVAKALTGANMALKDREEIRDSLARANSPAQLKGVVKTLQELMGGQLESLQLQYESGTGRKDFDKKMTGRAKEVVSSLQGQTSAKPAAQAAAMYARNPKTGERIMSLDGGNTWSPAR